MVDQDTQAKTEKSIKSLLDGARGLKEITEGLQQQKTAKEAELKANPMAAAAIARDISGIQTLLAQAAAAAQQLGEFLKQVRPTVQAIGGTLVDIFNALVGVTGSIIGLATGLIKEGTKLVKVLTIVGIFFQKNNDVKVAGTVLTQPLADESLSSLAAVTDEDARVFGEFDIETVGQLAEAELRDLKRCGIDLARAAELQGVAQVVAAPFPEDFGLLIEELDMSLGEVARQAPAGFMLPFFRVHSVLTDLHIRSTLLSEGVLERHTVNDVIDVVIPEQTLEDPKANPVAQQLFAAVRAARSDLGLESRPNTSFNVATLVIERKDPAMRMLADRPARPAIDAPTV